MNELDTDREVMVSVDGLRKEYGGGEDSVVAVDDVSFDVGRGSITGLLGHNGAGKTTLIKSMLGLIEPTAGRVTVGDAEVTESPTAAFDHAAAVLEGARTTYWRLTVRENVRFFTWIAGYDPAERRERNRELYEAFDIADKVDTTVNELSRGMKQKAAVVTVLAQQPDVLFLDEPTLGLDVESSLELRRRLRELVREEGTTVFVSSHDMEVVEEICDRVIVLSDGSVVADQSVEELIDLFDTRTLAATLEGADETTRSRLAEEFEVVSQSALRDREVGTGPGDGESVATGKNRHEVEVAVDDTQTLHEFTGVLADAGVTVTDIETTQLDFSEVYLRLTSDEGRPDSDEGRPDSDEELSDSDEELSDSDEELSDEEGQSGSAGRPEGSINRDDDDDRTERDIDRDDDDRTERDIDRDDADRTERDIDRDDADRTEGSVDA